MVDHLSLIIDDRRSGDLSANNELCWRAISDTVMGGVSTAKLEPTVVAGRPCLRLTGRVSLENNGGFVQASLDLSNSDFLDAVGYDGIEIDIYGNGQTYNLHLRTDNTFQVWHSYRTSFLAPPQWTTLRLPFESFRPHRIDKPLDQRKLRRIGLVSIGAEGKVEVCIACVSLYKLSKPT